MGAGETNKHMDIKELFNTAKTDTREHFKRKLSELVRENVSYRNLNSANQKIIMDIIYKHIEAIREGRGISSYLIQQETHRLYDKRLKLNTTEQDLADIREILGLFKK